MGDASKERCRSGYWGQCNGSSQPATVMAGRRFPPPWSVEELDLLCRDWQRRTKAVAAIPRVPDRDSLSRFPDQVSLRAWLECVKRISKSC